MMTLVDISFMSLPLFQPRPASLQSLSQRSMSGPGELDERILIRVDVKWGYIARFSGSQTQGGVRGWASGGAEATVSVTDYLFNAGASNMGWL